MKVFTKKIYKETTWQFQLYELWRKKTSENPLYDYRNHGVNCRCCTRIPKENSTHPFKVEMNRPRVRGRPKVGALYQGITPPSNWSTTMMAGRPKGVASNTGTDLTPRWNNGNINWDKVFEYHIAGIIAAQIAPNTLRGLMYILKSMNILKKSDYKGLTIHCRDWRKSGQIGWDDIIDGSGRGVINDFGDYSSPHSFANAHIKYLKNGAINYRQLLETKWRWYGQHNYVEIWCEKHAIVGTVARLVKDRYVRIAFNKGNPGWRYMRDNCERLSNELEEHERIYIFYLGDWDRYGRHMDVELKEQ